VWWVYTDAVKHSAAGEPVVFLSGAFRLETPSAWATVCLVLRVLFFPVYLRARQRSI
jgi:hypothetical protein